MTTEKKIECIRWWIAEAIKSKGGLAEDLNFGIASGMLHAWGIDGSISFATSEELREEIRITQCENKEEIVK